MSAYQEIVGSLVRYKNRHGELPVKWFVDRYTLAELKDEGRQMCLRPGPPQPVDLTLMGVQIIERTWLL